MLTLPGSEFAQSYETEFGGFRDKKTDYCFTEMPVSHFSRSLTAMLQALLVLQAKIHLVITSFHSYHYHPQPLHSNKYSWLEDSLNSFAVLFNCYFTHLPPWHSVVIKCDPRWLTTASFILKLKTYLTSKGDFNQIKTVSHGYTTQAYTRHSYFLFLVLSISQLTHVFFCVLGLLHILLQLFFFTRQYLCWKSFFR